MPGQSKIHSLKRPAIERMLRIHHELKSGRFPNCSTIARELEVSGKTISRDIDFMRDRMYLPIEYDAVERGYSYTCEVESLPSIDISEGELLALSIARKAMDHYKGTPFEKPLANALNKLAASLPDTITANLDALSDTISFRQGRLSEIDEEVLQAFTKAALERRVIRFEYRKLGDKQGAGREMRPYHLTNYQGKWYAIGWDLGRGAMRTFMLSRASEPKIGKETFDLPEGFSAEDYLWSSFGIFSASGDQTVKVRFFPPAADHVAENTWHPTQALEWRSDGSVDIEWQLGGLQEVSTWILSWGPQALAIEPPELRIMLRDAAQKTLDRYL